MPDTRPAGPFLQTPSQTVGPFFGYALPYAGGPDVRAAVAARRDPAARHGVRRRGRPGARRGHRDLGRGCRGPPDRGARQPRPRRPRRSRASAAPRSIATATTRSRRSSPGATRPDAAPYVLVTVFARGLTAPPLHPGVLRRRGRARTPRPAASRASTRSRAARSSPRPTRPGSLPVRHPPAGRGRDRLPRLRAATPMTEPAACDWGLLEPWARRDRRGIDDDAVLAATGRRRARAAARVGRRVAATPTMPRAPQRRRGSTSGRRSTARRCSRGVARGRRARRPARARSCARSRGRRPGSGRRLHDGATSQDILDTGLVLVASDVLDAVRGRARRGGRTPRRARRRRAVDACAIARTLGQHAEATTLGVLVAGLARRRSRRAIEVVDAARLPGAARRRRRHRAAADRRAGSPA